MAYAVSATIAISLVWAARCSPIFGLFWITAAFWTPLSIFGGPATDRIGIFGQRARERSSPGSPQALLARRLRKSEFLDAVRFDGDDVPSIKMDGARASRSCRNLEHLPEIVIPNT